MGEREPIQLLVVDAVNAKGGVLGQKLELVTYYDHAKSDQAISTANKSRPLLSKSSRRCRP